MSNLVVVPLHCQPAEIAVKMRMSRLCNSLKFLRMPKTSYFFSFSLTRFMMLTDFSAFFCFVVSFDTFIFAIVIAVIAANAAKPIEQFQSRVLCVYVYVSKIHQLFLC